MKKGKKISKSAMARANFKSWDMTGIPEVKDKKGKVYHKMKGEKFVESPTLSKKYGKNYFYISNKGHLISFKNPASPILKTPDKKDSERERYVIYNAKTRKNDHYLIHRLVAEAFVIYAYGLATKTSDVHHERGYRPDKSIVYNNNPEYLERVSDRVHPLLTKLQQRPRNERTEQEELEIMQALSYIASIEEPDKISFLIDDKELKAIYAADEVGFSARAYIQLQLMIRAWMCTEYLKTQGLKDSIKYPVYFTIEQGTKKPTVVAIYEFKPEEGKSELIPCTPDVTKNIYDTMKGVTDDLLRGYQLLAQGYPVG